MYILTTDDFRGETKAGGSMYKLVDPSRTSVSCRKPDSSKVVFHPNTTFISNIKTSKCGQEKCKTNNKHRKYNRTRKQKIKAALKVVKNKINSRKTSRKNKKLLIRIYRKLKRAYRNETIQPQTFNKNNF